jgi:hypothetical protein
VKPTKEPPATDAGDVVLREIWSIKDELSAAREHDVHRLFAELRKREMTSGHSGESPDRPPQSVTQEAKLNRLRAAMRTRN